MDQPSVAELLPGLYRAILDVVADLEARKRRGEAAEIRAEATRIYSRAWTADAARRLQALRARGDRIADLRVRTRYETVIERLGRAPDLERRTA